VTVVAHAIVAHAIVAHASQRGSPKQAPNRPQTGPKQALGLDAAPLLSLQMKYNLLSAKRNKPFFEHLKKIPRIAAVF
jgi:hypothetical protein